MATYTYLNSKSGFLETIDLATGKLLAIGSGTSDPLAHREYYDEVTLANGEIVLLEKGADLTLARGHRSWAFDQTIADLFCQKVAEGMGVTKACGQQGMPPYPIVCRWKRERPDFARQLDEARKDRAEHLRDRAIDTAELADEDSVQADRLKVDTYKWAAGMDDQNRYGVKKVQFDADTPLQIVVNTGIVRDVSNNTEVKHATSSVPTKILESNNSGSSTTDQRDEPES